MMRVGIVTLPFHFNYGGILQAFALQKAIQNLGFEPIIIEQPSNNIKRKHSASCVFLSKL